MLLLLVLCILVYLVLWVSIKEYKQTNYYKVTGKGFFSLYQNKGDLGEYLTYKYLKGFEKRGAKFLFNLYLPRDNGETTEIDVLMISAGGLYVFESKNYSGWIFGNERGRTWTQTLPNGRKSKKEHFLNPIMQNKLHIKWLNILLDNEKIPVHSLIVFSERCTLKKIELYSNDIKVIKRDQVYAAVNKIEAATSEVLSTTEICALYEKLYSYTQVSVEEKQKHIENIKSKQIALNASKDSVIAKEKVVNNVVQEERVLDTSSKVNIEATEKCICPKCGAELILRTAKKGDNKGKQFYGCSAFPKCRYIKNME